MQLGHLPGLIARTARSNQVPGAQLAVCHGDRTWTYSYGRTTNRGGVRLTGDAKIPIGSITKTCTAALAMVLVSDGDLDLDEPVAEYLPELRRLSPEIAGGLTSRHVLSHTGGLAAECAGTPAGRAGWSRWLRSVQPPGAGFSYSNLGYALVGQLVEAVTGVTWWQAMRDILLKPLGITPAFITETDQEPAGPAFVPGHTVNRATHRVRPVEQALEPVEAPAGALALSAADLVTFGRALHADHSATDLVAPAELAEMRSPVEEAVPFGLADGWALGLAIFRDGSRVWLGHDGMAGGTSCHLRINPATGTVVALTTNASTGHNLWQDVVDELRSAGIDVGDYTAPIPSGRRVAPPNGCAGSYHNGDIEYTVTVQGDDVQLVVDGEPTARMVPHDGLVFSMIDRDTGETARPGRFLRDSHGYIDRIQVGGRVARRRRRVRGVA